MARRYGATWWGRAWVDAVENRASLDPNRLPRGRTYARHGHVVSVETSAGSIRAAVSGRRRHPYRVDIRFRTFDDREWAALLDVMVTRADRVAALLDGELDPGLVDDAAAAGIQLLPHAGELRPRCSCPDVADPCKHSAAVCYLVADELDADPFVLLQLRGRRREAVLDGVRSLRARLTEPADGGRRLEGSATVASGSTPAGGPVAGGADDPGVRAGDAWTRPLGPLPEVPSPRLHPGRPAPMVGDPPPAAPFAADGLEALATDAATRAWSALTGDADLHLGLSPNHDLARRAAVGLRATGSADELARLSRLTGVTPRSMARRAIAWQLAGSSGVNALDEPPWRPDPLTMASARNELIEWGDGHRRITVDRNRITVDDEQLRLSRTGQWWRFVKRGGAWDLDAGPADEPTDVLPT
ncbi:MAG: SWIM zinc finger family protein [Acidimicrobiales bacterium]